MGKCFGGGLCFKNFEMCYVLKRVDGAGSHYLLRSEDFLATLEALSSYHVFLVFRNANDVYRTKALHSPQGPWPVTLTHDSTHKSQD